MKIRVLKLISLIVDSFKKYYKYHPGQNRIIKEPLQIELKIKAEKERILQHRENGECDHLNVSDKENESNRENLDSKSNKPCIDKKVLLQEADKTIKKVYV